MNELIITNFNGVETIDSRLIAESLEKRHADLMRDIAKYCGYLNESKIALVDFFIESNYKDSKGETRPCYLCTRKGCEMIANKMTGAKGTVFTAMYINAFHSMEQELKEPKTVKSTSKQKEKELDVKMMNARVRMSNQLLKLANISTLSNDWKNILVSKSAEVLTGEQLIPLPKVEEKTYTATEIGEMFGVSAQKVGSIANKNNLKTAEFGEWYKDKSPYSNKEVDTFRYNEKAIDKFREIIE